MAKKSPKMPNLGQNYSKITTLITKIELAPQAWARAPFPKSHEFIWPSASPQGAVPLPLLRWLLHSWRIPWDQGLVGRDKPPADRPSLRSCPESYGIEC
jgi:hypothetical protein